MSDSTFHVTGEDVRKMEAKESKFHDGKTPADSDTSAMKVSNTEACVDQYLTVSIANPL